MGIPQEKIVKTKIVCTLGPASDDPETLRRMINAGMDVCRQNFSHGDHSYHEKLFHRVRELAHDCGEQVSILCDVQGPKIRTGLVKEPFTLRTGDFIKVTPEPVLGTPECVQIRYPTILKDLDVGDTIFINDGIVKLVVREKLPRALSCEVEAGGMISDHKGCNIPSGNVSIEVPTEKDEEDLALIAQLDPEFVAASFIGSARDVEKVRECLHENGNKDVKIISKIERPVALKNLDEIIAVSDGLMVARGDLGVEIPPYEVPIAQKTIVRRCNREGRPVIVATQMLESMTTQSRPTRAEANDVFNAVLDGADAVMLSGETSVGKYPVEAVRFMDDIVSTAERFMPQRDPDYYDSSSQTEVETIGHACFTIANEFHDLNWPGKILAVTDSGYTARMISKYRPGLPIVALTANLRTARELNLVWGVRAVYSEDVVGANLEERAINAIVRAFSMGLLATEDHVVVVSSSMIDRSWGTFTGVYDVGKVLRTR
ncbi:MAG: pyruvate kinase [Promethearchaeota archaeon]